MAYTEAFHAPGGPVSDSLLSSRKSQTKSRAIWRKRLLIGLGLFSLLAAALAGTHWYLLSLTTVFTDDAYVDAPLAEITPQIDGTIQQVLVTDTQHVERGDLLVRLDPADADLAVRQARAWRAQRPVLSNVSVAKTPRDLKDALRPSAPPREAP